MPSPSVRDQDIRNQSDANGKYPSGILRRFGMYEHDCYRCARDANREAVPVKKPQPMVPEISPVSRYVIGLIHVEVNIHDSERIFLS